jgi:flagellin
MALGVLNNLSAIYAENNLNNTNSSLQTVLEQLSSGSKINSGADDAAGLSLVNGLEANQTALTQSETNATEGAGLLQVADGALSQVTSLLDRAITLATEASNGTLNSTQEGAANQEYQSILSEVNNIGQTTTYNQEQVFNGQEVAIYTGDSSMAGSSVDDLNIRTLSESSLGDTGGKMAYSSGSNSVFVNMSSGTANAQASDALDGGLSGANTMSVTYLVKGTDGSESTATTSISVGGASGFANTVGGLINAINDSGLGLTATLATQAQAGVQGGGTETGIEITGGLVSAGVDPNSASTSGTLDLTGLAPNATLALGAQITVTQGTHSQLFTINSSNNTLQSLAGVISGTSGLGVTASVITNGDGTQSLSVADTGSAGGALGVSVQYSGGTTQAPVFGAGSTGSTVAVQTAGTSVNGNVYLPSLSSSIVVGTTGGGELASDQLTEGTSITIENTISNNFQNQTFVIGDGVNNTPAGTYYTGNANGGAGGTTLGSLADAINAQSGTLGVFATIGANGLTITTGTAGAGSWVSGTYTGGTSTTLTGQNVSVTANSLTSATTNQSLALYTPTIGGAAAGGSPTITALDLGANAANENDVLAGTFTLSDTQSGGPVSFVMSGADTWQTLINDINGSTLGLSAQWNGNEGGAGDGGIQLTATSNAVDPVTLTPVSGGIKDGATAIIKDVAGVGVQPGALGNVDATPSTAILQLGPGDGNITDSGGSASVLGGAINITYHGTNQVFIMGSAPSSGAVANAIYTNGNSVTSLINAINASAMGGVTNALYAFDVVAIDNAGMGGTGGIYLQGIAGYSGQFGIGAINNPIGTESALSVTSGVYVGDVNNTPTGAGSTAATGQAGNNAVDNVTAGGGVVVSTGDTMAGHITVTNSASGVTDTFNVGTGNDSYNTVTKVGNYYTNNTNATVQAGLPGALENYGNSLQGLAAAISAMSSTLGVNAQANTSGLTLTQSGTTGTYTGGNITTSQNNLTDVTEGVFSTATTNEIANENDTLSGSVAFNVGGAANGTQTVTMADVALANSNENVSEVTAEQLIQFITNNESTGLDLGVSAQWIPSSTQGSTFGSIQLTSGTQGTSGTVNVSSALTSLTDTTTGSGLSYTSNNAYNVGLSGSIGDLTTQQAAATFTSNSKASSGTATISYTDGAGESVNTTDLLNQTDAESALNDLNVAITDVAAQDGYIGAQINTLNSISQVMSTQQENVVSAQNAIQATDYASATSNMSKYEILSQTGIAALAQANSVEQEVTKLLQ